MNGLTILQACLGCIYQGELIVNHLRSGRNLAYLMTKVDASRKTSFRKMVESARKLNMESIAISKCRDHLANCPKPNWVCLKMLGIFPMIASHLIGIMIMKTIRFRGLAYFQTHPI